MDFDYLKTKYSAAGYSVQQSKEGTITVYKNGKPYIQYEKIKSYSGQYSKDIFNFNIFTDGKILKTVNVQRGKICYSETFNPDGSSESFRYKNGNIRKIDLKTVKDKNGNTVSTYYRGNGDIEHSLEGNKRIDYAGNKPFRVLEGRNLSYKVGVKNLKDAISSKDYYLVKKNY